ncbi:dynein axonemal heavy chain 5-like [Protopterus annectens]|uniref:dynein axonemal heavy chain 5-like n=1 Tax=Protopterus annectens TaxID=7888 RepID=UPI001CFBBC60|nr:dynein axonemal heavy chain 5-like [Protopterus annectens]
MWALAEILSSPAHQIVELTTVSQIPSIPPRTRMSSEPECQEIVVLEPAEPVITHNISAPTSALISSMLSSIEESGSRHSLVGSGRVRVELDPCQSRLSHLELQRRARKSRRFTFKYRGERLINVFPLELKHVPLDLMQKLKEEREAKRSQLDARHDYILGIVASSLGLDSAEVEDAILDGSQIERIDRFFAAGGLPHLMFYYQEVDPNETGILTGTARSRKPKLFVTEGNDVALSGTCIFFVRSNTSKTVTTENVHKEVSFNILDTSDNGLLRSMEQLLSEIFIPAVKRMNQGWGELNTNQAASVRQEFLNTLDGFVSVLNGAQQSLLEKVNLKECETYDLKALKGPSDYLTAANSTEALEKIETCMKVWIKQIEQVLAESDQLRKEADDLGPRAELDHWKKRMSRFNYLLDQLKAQEVKAVLGVLTVAKSKLLKTWRELDTRITDAANEAKDNVKYLYTLEKFCDPLYNSDPVSMIDAIPGLINAVRMIHSISRYYNTSEKITSLFVKVTNQMITACKAYITNNGTTTIWDQPQDVIVEKLKAAIRLNQEYQHCFHKTKQKLEQIPTERQFDFSEMYIFGKFDTFQRRLNKIIDMFSAITMYSTLQDSKIEGLEVMATRFQYG